jgi:CRP-like cAMP-binding protein
VPPGPLRKNPLFAGVAAALLDGLIEASTLKRYKRGARVLSEGDPASVAALERGGLRVFHSAPGGQEVEVRTFVAPAIFGIEEALSGIPHLEDVEATQESEVLLMPTAEVLRLLEADPRCAIRILKDVATRFALTIRNEKSLVFAPATMRLANYLIESAVRSSDPGSHRLMVSLTQEQLSAAIGASRRSIATDMKRWLSAGILERHGRHYVVRNLEGLRRFADPRHLGVSHTAGQEIADLARRLERYR